MKLAHPELDAVLDFSVNRVNTLVIENQGFFFRFLQDIRDQIDGFDGNAVLSEQDAPVPFSRRAEILDSFLSFEVNRKPLLTKITAAMERIAQNETYYIRTAELMQQLEAYVMDLAQAFSGNIVSGLSGIGALLKAMKLEIADDAASPLERIYNYMELVREFDSEKLFIFVNLRSWFSDEEVSAFLECARTHGYSMLLIDNREYERLPYERRVVIDRDLCEF